MKRKNTTRNALITSIISMLLCVSMLVGTTFAWFTDEVTSGRNTIASGNLDVVLEYKNDWDDEWKPVDENTKIFKDGALYEPGYTEVVFLRVSNAGSLALKYNLTVDVYEETPSTNVNDEEFKLSDYLQVGTYIQDEYNGDANYADILMPIMFGSREAALGSVTLGKLADFDGSLASSRPLLPGDKTAQVMAVVLTMPETVGNEANHKTGVAAPQITLGVKLLAAQYTHEEDSFDNQYDADADWTQPVKRNEITNLEELRAAAAAGGEYYLADNVTIGAEEVAVAVNNDFVLYLDGYSIDASAMAGRPFELADGVDFTINGEVSNDYTSNVEGQEAVLLGTYGLINIPADNNATITLNGGKYVGATDNGSFIKPRGTGAVSITMNDVVAIDQSSNGSYLIHAGDYAGTQFEMVVNGGYYESYAGFNVPYADIKGATIVATGDGLSPALAAQYTTKSTVVGIWAEDCVIKAAGCAVYVANGSVVNLKNVDITVEDPAADYVMRHASSGGTINAENLMNNGTAVVDKTTLKQAGLYGATGKVRNNPAIINLDGEEVYYKLSA